MHTLSPEIGNYTSFGNLRNLNPSNLVNSDFIWRKLCCFFYLKKFFLSKYQKGRLEDLSIICVCPSRCWFDEISLFFACFCCLIVCQFLSFCLFLTYGYFYCPYIWCNILEFTRDCAKLKVVWGLWLLELIDLALWAIIEEPGEPSISWKMPGGGNTKAPKQHWHLLLCSVNELCSTFAKRLIFCLFFVNLSNSI